ncbi:hypothetical protein ScPMuIL_009414 [Solemya velum]
MALVVLLIAIISTVTSHDTCHCEKKGHHKMIKCEEYCCKEDKNECHCCEEEDSKHFKHSKHWNGHMLIITLPTVTVFLLILFVGGGVCLFKRMKKNTTKDTKVMPSIAIVCNSKEKEALGLDQKSYPPPAYPMQAFSDAPPSYSQINLRNATLIDGPTCPTYESLDKPKE